MALPSWFYYGIIILGMFIADYGMSEMKIAGNKKALNMSSELLNLILRLKDYSSIRIRFCL